MGNAPELKPCPWCGQSPKEIIDATRFLGVHRILHRGCVLPNFAIEAATPEAAAALWNTRADLAPTDAQVMAHPKVRALVENAKVEAVACVIYLTTASDRGGIHGPKGKRRKALEQAHARLCAALRDLGEPT